MGILNVTPDSFADGGLWTEPSRAVDAALQMEADGADLIDIGGESTRPGAEALPLDVELARVMPVIEALASRLRVPISVDTYKAEVASRALAAGAALVNDVSALRYDSALAAVVAQTGAALVLMHNRGRSRQMYQDAHYRSVVDEVAGELAERVEAAVASGVARDRIIVDPGLGFAKRAEHSLEVLARLPEIGQARSAAAGRAVAQVVSEDRARRSRAGRSRVGHGGRRGRRRDGRRAHRSRSRRERDGGRRAHGRRDPRCRTSNLIEPPATRPNQAEPDQPDQTPPMNFSWISEALGRPPIGWRDVVDIAIVSIVIYEVLTLIRGTRAAQMAVGGALAVGLFYVSRLVELETVNWLIRNLIGYIVFAAIVLFQSDIRRALAHLGRAPFFRYLAKGETVDETVEEIAVAAQMLSSQRTGAIIAIERQIGLRNYAEGGIPLDAQISYDLLVTIFQNGTPLHDGAVIIQENRVAAAACFLPLTVNPRLSKDLGTRHRAAIGLTEENDAVAVVVSEETGWVSVVLEGRIERNLTPERLRGRLRATAAPAPRRRAVAGRPRGRLTCGLASSGTSAPRCCPSGWRRCCGAWWQGNAKPSVPCECRSSIATSRPSSSCSASRRRWSTCASAAAAACWASCAAPTWWRCSICGALVRGAACSTCCRATSPCPPA